MKRAIPLGAGLLGILFTLRTMIFSGFRLIPGDAGDTRFVELLMEYSYRWLTGHEGGRAYWDFPMFYPVKNTLAYSETMLGAAPFYWVWRILGLAPDTSYALWLITVLALSFASAYLLFRRGLALGEVAAAAGAWFLAFGSPRIAQLNHPQLTPVFWAILAVYALVRMWRDPGKRPWLWPWVFGGAMALQFYASFYTAMFLAIAVVIALLWALVFPWTRRALLLPLRDPVVLVSWGAAGVISLALLYPMGAHYLEASHVVGVREYWYVEAWLPRMASWVYQGPMSWLYGWLAPRPMFLALPISEEQQLGIGWVTPLLVFWGLIATWKQRASALLGLCVLCLLLITATVALPGVSFWKIWYYTLPGVSALRSVSRVGIFLLLPCALGLAFWVQRFRGRIALVAVGLVLVFAEQARGVPSFDITRARQTIRDMELVLEPATCPYFFATVSAASDAPWKYQIDAMWAAVETGVPTINGYSGNFPSNWWDMYDINVRSKDQAVILNRGVSKWLMEHSLDPSKVCLADVRVR